MVSGGFEKYGFAGEAPHLGGVSAALHSAAFADCRRRRLAEIVRRMRALAAGASRRAIVDFCLKRSLKPQNPLMSGACAACCSMRRLLIAAAKINDGTPAGASGVRPSGGGAPCARK